MEMCGFSISCIHMRMYTSTAQLDSRDETEIPNECWIGIALYCNSLAWRMIVRSLDRCVMCILIHFSGAQKYIYRWANCTVVVPMNVVRFPKETNRHCMYVCVPATEKRFSQSEVVVRVESLVFWAFSVCAFLYNMAKIDELYVRLQRSSRRRYYIELEF